MSIRQVLIVEANTILRQSLAEQLAREGAFNVVEAESLSSAQTALGEGLFAAMVLDQALPAFAGLKTIQGWRQAGFTMPILLLAETEAETAHGVEETEIGDSSASDSGVYILVKPFRFAHLLTQLHALTGQLDEADGQIVQIGPFQFHPRAKMLAEGGRRIFLTEKESEILRYLHRAGDVVPREMLLNEVWGYNPAVTTHTLETHIYRLRQKIMKDQQSGKELLITEMGGYRLMP